MSLAIHWFRRDFRVADNTALAAAVARHGQVAPVYILSTWTERHGWTGPPRQEFLCGCLADLARNLERLGGRLLIRQGAADQELERLARESGAQAIYFNHDPDPFGRAMEQKVAAMAARLGIEVHGCKDATLQARDEVLTGSGTPFRVFTPFARAWLKLEKTLPVPALTRLSTPPHLTSLELPTLATWRLHSTAKIIEPGEAAARQRLGRFLDGPIFHYSTDRNFPARPTNSRFSQDLRHGLLSIRELYAACLAVAERTTQEQRRSVEVFVNELIWREFYQQVLWFHPEVLDTEYQASFRTVKWRLPNDAFDRWCAGETGFPIVDAGMRQLNASGFLHNRGRMIVAMFLTKDLHLSWKAGEQFFHQRLVDAEIASNNGGWQWCAGTGTDAAPFFRVQNPWRQTAQCDPDGAYIRQWVPELRDVPPARLAAPPAPGVRLAKGYPAPMVDHAAEREVALEMYREARVGEQR